MSLPSAKFGALTLGVPLFIGVAIYMDTTRQGSYERIEVNNYRKRRVRVHVTEFNNDGLMWAVVASGVGCRRSGLRFFGRNSCIPAQSLRRFVNPCIWGRAYGVEFAAHRIVGARRSHCHDPGNRFWFRNSTDTHRELLAKSF